MKNNLRLLAISVITGISTLSAQTTPTPWNLNSAGNYSFTGFSPAASSLPASMAIHQMSASPVALSSNAVSDIPLPCPQLAPNNTNVWGLNAQGLGIRSNPVAASTGYTNGKLSQVIVSVNSTGRTNIKVSFKAGTSVVASAQAAIFRLRCQYRVGITGVWSELSGTPVEYQPVAAIDSVNMGPYTLPSAADNKAVVQIRWIYYYVSGSWTVTNNRTHRVRLDDISITTKPIVLLPAFPTICPNSSSFVLSGGSPAGGTYSGTGVSGGTFNPAVAGVGTFPITYSYTDAFGNTNSATQNITVDYNACTTQLNSTWCGATNITLDETIYCDPVVNVENYEWKFTNASTGNSLSLVKGNAYESFGLWIVSNMQYGQSYNVQVRAKVLGQWRNWGTACNLTLLPTIPTTQLAVAYCGMTHASLSDVLYSDPVAAATNFQYEFTNSSGFNTLYTKNNTTPSIALSDVPGVTYGQSYNVRVKSYVNGVWSSFGNSCAITMINNIPITQLDAPYCGATNLTLGDVIYCNPVSNATGLQFEFTNASGYSYTYSKNSGSTSAALSVIPGLQYGSTYNVRVRSLVSGIWSNFGNSCTISFQNNIPATQLNASSCGSTYLTTQSVIYCNPVAAATGLQFEFTNSSGYYYQYTKNSGSTSVALWIIPGLSDGQSYNVRVRSYVSGTWSPYGPVCNITLGGAARLAKNNSIGETDFTAQLLPNPLNKGEAPKLRIEGADGRVAGIMIMDHTGKTVLLNEIPVTGNVFETQIGEFTQLEAGLYLMRINAGGTTSVKRFIVE